MKQRVRQAYVREFERAPRASAGAVVTFIRLDPKNPAWFFGRDQAGVEGFFPVQWFELAGVGARARRDYDAAELTVNVGTEVEVGERYGQWVHVTDPTGARGWILESCLG